MCLLRAFDGYLWSIVEIWLHLDGELDLLNDLYDSVMTTAACFLFRPGIVVDLKTSFMIRMHTDDR
jgi:hypothetical protein